MKKLLIVFLVLAMAPLASAAFTIGIDVNGSPWNGSDFVSGSDTIKVTITTTTSIGQMVNALTNVSDGDNQANMTLYSTSQWSLGSFGTLAADGSGGVDATMGGALLMGSFAAGDVYSFEFHVPNTLVKSDYIIIDPAGGSFNYTAASADTLATIDTEGNGADGLPVIVLHVPEPMTIALLGLGGLLLRRRRK